MMTLRKQDPKAGFTPVPVDNGACDYGGKVKGRIWGPWSWGTKPLKRNSAKDWDTIWENAKTGKISDIPADIRVRCYNQLKRIEKDHMVVTGQHSDCKGYWIWGASGIGKSTLARDLDALFNVYIKPRKEWWDGYDQ